MPKQTQNESITGHKSQDSFQATTGLPEQVEELTNFYLKEVEQIRLVFTQLEKENVKFGESIQEQKIEIKKLTDKIDENRTKLVEMLGLYIALFTFISVEFALFTTLSYYSQLLSLTFILAGLLLLFVLILDFMMKTHNTRMKNFTFFYILPVILLSIGIGIPFISDRFDKKINTDYHHSEQKIEMPTKTETLTISPTISITNIILSPNE